MGTECCQYMGYRRKPCAGVATILGDALLSLIQRRGKLLCHSFREGAWAKEEPRPNLLQANSLPLEYRR